MLVLGGVVEIDESKFTKRKMKKGNPGRLTQDLGWVVGIYDRKIKEAQTIVVQHRDAETMLEIAENYISSIGSF